LENSCIRYFEKKKEGEHGPMPGSPNLEHKGRRSVQQHSKGISDAVMRTTDSGNHKKSGGAAFKKPMFCKARPKKGFKVVLQEKSILRRRSRSGSRNNRRRMVSKNASDWENRWREKEIRVTNRILDADAS